MMLFQFLDENGNESVATYPDDSKFVIREADDGRCYIIVHLPGPARPRVPSQQQFLGPLGKETANLCIGRIYRMLASGKKDCSLVDLQQK